MALKTTESFGAWLLSQEHRNDPVGDLARDFRASGSQATTFYGIRTSMSRHRASEHAYAALDRALEEWPG